jgi:hypothetical protein
MKAMAEERTFIVTIDVTDPDLQIANVREVLTTHEGISNWWNYIPGVYLVRTVLTADQIGDLIKPKSAGASFLVTEVNLRRSEGWLSERAWRWIRRRSREDAKTAGTV